MTTTFEKLEFLATVSIRSILEKVKDPKRELLQRIQKLSQALEEGQQDLAHGNTALAQYERAEADIENQIVLAQKMAVKFADSDEKAALANVQEEQRLTKDLEEAKVRTKGHRDELARLDLAIEAVRERLANLEAAFDKIELIGDRAEQLEALREVADEEERAANLEESALRRLYTAEARLEMDGVPVPNEEPSETDMLRDRLAELKKAQQ